MLKDKLSSQLNDLSNETEELKGEMVDVKGYVNTKIEENREMIMEMEEEVIERETMNSGIKASNVNRTGQKSEDFTKLERDVQNWKAATEQKNLNVFKEISSALKSMKIEWKKENDELSSLVGSYE